MVICFRLENISHRVLRPVMSDCHCGQLTHILEQALELKTAFKLREMREQNWYDAQRGAISVNFRTQKVLGNPVQNHNTPETRRVHLVTKGKRVC